MLFFCNTSLATVVNKYCSSIRGLVVVFVAEKVNRNHTMALADIVLTFALPLNFNGGANFNQAQEFIHFLIGDGNAAVGPVKALNKLGATLIIQL